MANKLNTNNPSTLKKNAVCLGIGVLKTSLILSGCSGEEPPMQPVVEHEINDNQSTSTIDMTSGNRYNPEDNVYIIDSNDQVEQNEQSQGDEIFLNPNIDVNISEDFIAVEFGRQWINENGLINGSIAKHPTARDMYIATGTTGCPGITGEVERRRVLHFYVDSNGKVTVIGDSWQ